MTDYETSYPSTMPSREEDIPLAVRRWLAWKALRKALDHYGGWREFARWLYMGERRPDGSTVRLNPTIDQLWPLVVQDAQAFEATRHTRGRE